MKPRLLDTYFREIFKKFSHHVNTNKGSVVKQYGYGGQHLSRQIRIHQGKFKSTAANSNSPRQIQINTANLKSTAANSNSPRQIQIIHLANSNSPRQIQIHHSKLKIHHGKFKFTTANLKYTGANSNSPWQIQRVCSLFVCCRSWACPWGLWIGSGSSR